MEYIKKADAISWGVLAGIVLVTYLFFSDGEFSLVFTLAGTVQAFGFALIVLRIRKSRSVSGLSRETFICYAIIFTIRSIIFIFFKVTAPLNIGIFAIRSIRRYHFQVAVGPCNSIRFLYFICDHWSIQDQLQPRSRYHQVLLPNCLRSHRRNLLPLQSKSINFC